MMELSILRSLLDKEFYNDYKGGKTPHHIFSKEASKIKTMIDEAMRKYDRDLSVSELEALMFSSDPLLTTAQKNEYSELFDGMRKETPLSKEVAEDVLSNLFRKHIGREISNLGIRYVNGDETTLESLRSYLDNYSDNFVPDIEIDWDDISPDTLLELNALETQWHFNIPSLNRHIEGVNAGHLIFCAARPNTGKTSFHASIIAGPNGFLQQGAKCVVLCNEESYHRVAMRYWTASTGLTDKEIAKNPYEAKQLYLSRTKSLRMKDTTGRDMNFVEQVCKTYRPDILVLDMGDKFSSRKSGASPQHEVLKACAIHARQIAKEYECAVFYMSQLSADAEGITAPDQSMLEGSKTGKAAEADLMLLISKNKVVEGMSEEEHNQRHIHIAKNKLNGYHDTIHCELNGGTARYSA